MIYERIETFYDLKFSCQLLKERKQMQCSLDIRIIKKYQKLNNLSKLNSLFTETFSCHILGNYNRKIWDQL